MAGNLQPTISSITPNQVTVNQATTLTVNGSNFQSGFSATVITSGGSFPVAAAGLSFLSSGQVQVQVTMGSTPPYSATLQITNPGGAIATGSFQVIASGPTTGTITANPTTCQVITATGRCTINLIWALKNTTFGQITVTDAIGNNQVVGLVSGSNGTFPIPWIQGPPQRYVFYLSDYSGGSQGAKLASVSVAATGPSGTTAAPTVGATPQRDVPGKSFTVYGSSLAPGQATIYVQPPNGSAVPVGSVSVAADGTFNGYSYPTQPSSPNGAYTVWAVDSSGAKSSTASFTVAQPTPASIPTCQSNTTTSGCNGDPINTATGNYTYQHTDLTIPGRGLPFAFTRTYNSQSGTPGPMGAGWTHSYMASLTQNADNSVSIVTPDGQSLIFDPVGGSYISRFNNVYSTLQSPSAGIFVLTTKNQVSYRFSKGQLMAVSDRNANTIQLTYSSGFLTAITDTVGRRLVVFSDPSGRITGIADPSGRSLQYQYDSAGNMVAFTDANGGTFNYSYDGSHAMLTAVDPQNNTFLTNTYDSSGRVISQSDGAGNRWTYAYDSTRL